MAANDRERYIVHRVGPVILLTKRSGVAKRGDSTHKEEIEVC